MFLVELEVDGRVGGLDDCDFGSEWEEFFFWCLFGNGCVVVFDDELGFVLVECCDFFY